ncbi:RsuA 16S rRNA uridine-516 pseudouridylate synthase and related pseudouridylate synthases [Burkholderiaceae bacterium]
MSQIDPPNEPLKNSGLLEKVRVSKLLSELGLCSRREADGYIEQGLVTVDGELVAELGTRAFRHQKIELRLAAQKQQEARVTVILNKPIGFISHLDDDQAYQPAASLITAQHYFTNPLEPDRCGRFNTRGLAPAGRLDIDSTGMLVLTQDGRIAKLLVGEDSPIEKEYLVRVTGKLSAAGLEQLNHGLSLDGQLLKRAKVSWQNEDQLRFVLREGRKRQIRRMCELVELQVLALKRIRIGQISLGSLPLGQWRYLKVGERF